MKQIQQIKLFISCPGDIKDELDSIRLITEEINKTSGRQNSYVIECLNWIVDTYTQIGEDSQDVINKQLDSEYDILVGILWQRIGTATKRDKSGTIEEINRALANSKKEALIYFKTTPPENLNLIDVEQLGKVNLFKAELFERGVLYKEFNSVNSFESLFRINIINLISDKLLINSKTSIVFANDPKTDKYASISEVINQVEQKSQNVDDELDIFELSEQIMSSLGIITSSLGSMTNSVDELTIKIRNRTNEIEKFNKLKDDRLRLNKTQIIVNLFAAELDEFNLRINQELPDFSENFLLIAPMYSRIMLFATNNFIEEGAIVKQSLLDFRDSVEGATINGAGMLQEIIKWPPMTTRFNKSKRQTEEILKNLIKEMLEGLKLLDEAIK